MNKLPAYSTDLIARLDRLFPPRCIQSRETPEQAHRYAGKRELVEYLLSLTGEASADPTERINVHEDT